MSISVADLHCDTLTEIYKTNQTLHSNNLHISLDKTENFRHHIQTFAVFIEDERENKTDYLKACCNYFTKQIEENNYSICLCTKYSDIIKAKTDKKTAAVLSAENISYVAETEDAVSLLARLGIKFATLTWNGENKLAGGALSKGDLTDAGRKALSEMEEKGIILDVSHLNEKSFYSVLEAAKRPIVATHSNSFALCSHPRNLKDDQIKEILATGGIIGLNLMPPFLSEDENCGIDAVLRHIEYFLELGAQDSLCLGCDYDGIDCTPKGLENISKLPDLYEGMQKMGISDEIIDKIFYLNYINFAEKEF